MQACATYNQQHTVLESINFLDDEYYISVFVRPPWAFLKSSILICSLSLDLNMSSPENWRHSVMFSSAESVTSRVEEKSRSLVTLEVPVCVARDISHK